MADSDRELHEGHSDILDSIDNRLRPIEALLAIGNSPQIAERRKQAGFDDAASDSILRFSDDWIAAGELKKRVIAASAQPERTVGRRLGGLVKLGALKRRGQGTSTEYRNTGLLG